MRGPTFIRLLARLADGDIPSSGPSLSEQLSRWIDWTPAVALYRALDGNVPVIHAGTPGFDHHAEATCANVRASLARAIAASREGPDDRDGTPASVAFAPFRQHYLAMQRAMQAATGPLRGSLRDMLAGTSQDMARLARVDALMEQVLSPREHTLLAAVPTLLGEHFERLKRHAQDAAVGGAWMHRFRMDMQCVLLAELDVRFHPIEGLLAALRNHLQGSHVQTSA